MRLQVGFRAVAICSCNCYVFTGGAKALLSNKITDISVDDLNCAKSAAEGATLGVFTYQDQKLEAKKLPNATLSLADGADGLDAWRTGQILASSQNFSRT